MKQAAVCLAFLFVSFTLTAQNPTEPASAVVILRGTPSGSGCPIGMHASHGVWDHTIRVRQGQQERVFQPFGQRILLTLSDTHPAAIVAATVKVTGTTGRNRMLQALAANSEGDGVRTVNVHFTAGPDGAVSGDLYVPGLTSVSSVELLQVSYHDGQEWRSGSSNVCRVAPDGFMLVAAH